MSKAHLRLLDAGDEQPVFELSAEETTIGRLSDSDIVITNPYVSRRHAKVIRRGGAFFVSDINSTHGTFVNGSRVSEQRLLPGDRISLGHDQVQLLFQDSEQIPEQQRTRLTSADMEKSVMHLTSVIPLPNTESSYLEKISHILDFQVHWEQSFSPEETFRQIVWYSVALALLTLLMPLVNAVGIDPVHFGLVVTVNLGIGQQTPPVASVLATAATIAKEDIWTVTRTNIYFIAVLVVVLLMVTYIPAIPLSLVHLFYG